jgi:hypothetical protein
MANDFYTPTGAPSRGSGVTSSPVNSEFALIAQAFSKFAALTGNNSGFVRVNSGATGQEAVQPTGTGLVVLNNAPTLVAPTLGVATVTSINGVAITAVAAATLAMANGSTLTTIGAFSATLTFSAATSVTFPTSGTLGTLAGAESLSNKTIVAPIITGVSAAPTAAVDTNTTQLATTAFVLAQAASQADMETASSLTKFTPPGRLHNHPGVSKGWVKARFDGAYEVAYNVSSITDVGAGRITVVWNVDFSSTHYCVGATAQLDPAGTAASTVIAQIFTSGTGAGQIDVIALRMSDFTGVDVNYLHVFAFGDQ